MTIYSLDVLIFLFGTCQVAKMVLNPQQLLQWQMWVNDEARQLMIDKQSHGNPASLTYDILTGTRAMDDMIAQLANITP